jgi:DNA-binding winged helix-turn-helix (wHTH) protein
MRFFLLLIGRRVRTVDEDPIENLLPVGCARQATGNSHTLNQLRFGPFLLDCANAGVFRDGTEVRMRSRVYEAINVLASRIGREVSVAELLKEACKGSVVSRHTVAVTVCEARKALAEYGNGIEYRPNRGYRRTFRRTIS